MIGTADVSFDAPFAILDLAIGLSSCAVPDSSISGILAVLPRALCTIRPLSRRMMRSALTNSSRWWVTRMMVVPCCCNSSRICMMSARPCGSSMAVGSSSTRISGFMASMPAMATRCCWPPLIRVGSASRCPLMSTASSDMAMRISISSCAMARFSGPKATSSSVTVVTI